MIDERVSPIYNVRTVLASASMEDVPGQVELNMDLGAYCLDRPCFAPAGCATLSASNNPCVSLFNLEV
jgi:hypothetical protein